MATIKDSEKGGSFSADPEKKYSMSRDRRASSKGNIDSIVAADLLDDRFQQTQRGLKSRHAQMIALGGTIGTGLFVGSGQTLARGGPAFILTCYIVITLSVYCVVTAITEVATYLPVHGGTMSYYGYRYVSRSMGFAMGYLYWYALGILVPYEITAAGLVIQYWDPDASINIAIWITIMIIVIGMSLAVHDTTFVQPLTFIDSTCSRIELHACQGVWGNGILVCRNKSCLTCGTIILGLHPLLGRGSGTGWHPRFRVLEKSRSS